jgi:hypothetical protein
VRLAALFFLVFLGVAGVILCIPKEVIELHTEPTG